MKFVAFSVWKIGLCAAVLSWADVVAADDQDCSLAEVKGTVSANENFKCILAKIEDLTETNKNLEKQIKDIQREEADDTAQDPKEDEYVDQKTAEDLISSAIGKIGDRLPIGTIVAWQGNGNVPQGWAICNGTNGTPDLRGRFLRGVGGTGEVGQQGGKSSHTLDLPLHSHNIAKGSRTNAMRAENGGGVMAHTTSVDYLYNTYTEDEHRSAAEIDFDVLPPYETVIYIMKIRVDQ